MYILERDWENYVNALGRINDRAAKKMQKYIETHGVSDRTALIDYAEKLVRKYGESSASLSALMYDQIMEAEGSVLPAAEAAEISSRDDIAAAINSVIDNEKMIVDVVARLVKLAGADTTLQNIKRDRGEFCWVARGDTCAFCIALASRGWQLATADQMNGAHASHIHTHCDCTFMTRKKSTTELENYDPDKWLEEYENADTSSYGMNHETHHYQNLSTAKINGIRRAQYAKNRDAINAQKRAAYAARMEKQRLEKWGDAGPETT